MWALQQRPENHCYTQYKGIVNYINYGIVWIFSVHFLWLGKLDKTVAFVGALALFSQLICIQDSGNMLFLGDFHWLILFLLLIAYWLFCILHCAHFKKQMLLLFIVWFNFYSGVYIWTVEVWQLVYQFIISYL